MELNLDGLKLSLLEAGGVDNWGNYGDAIQIYIEENYDEDEDADLSSGETLNALENGGVDNWEWYGESLGSFNEYKWYIQDLPEGSDYMSYDEFVEKQEREEQEEKEQEKLAKTKKQEEEHIAKVESDKQAKQDFYAKDPSELEFPQLFSLIEEIYPNHSHVENKDVYEFILTESDLFKMQTFTPEFNKAKKDFFKNSEDKTAGTFFREVRPAFINLVIKHGKMKPFIIEKWESK